MLYNLELNGSWPTLVNQVRKVVTVIIGCLLSTLGTPNDHSYHFVFLIMVKTYA